MRHSMFILLLLTLMLASGGCCSAPAPFPPPEVVVVVGRRWYGVRSAGGPKNGRGVVQTLSSGPLNIFEVNKKI